MGRRVGIGLVVTAYALLLYMSLAAPAYARAHPHMDKAMLAEYTAPWPVALAVAVVGILLALIPIRRGERWALWTAVITLIILGSLPTTLPGRARFTSVHLAEPRPEGVGLRRHVRQYRRAVYQLAGPEPACSD